MLGDNPLNLMIKQCKADIAFYKLELKRMKEFPDVEDHLKREIEFLYEELLKLENTKRRRAKEGIEYGKTS